MFFHFSKPRISECKESLLALPSESGFVQQRRIAGYVTAKKGKTDKKEHKKASTTRGNVIIFFERNLNSFLLYIKKSGVPQ